MRQVASRASVEAIRRVAVPTRDRAASLKEVLGTCVDGALRSGRAVEVLVADDSVRAEARDDCLEVLEALGVPARYAGRVERLRYAEALSRAGIDRDVVNFAILDPEMVGYSPGANRNGIFLDTLGERFLSIDDDQPCSLSRVPDPKPGLALAPGDPTEVWYFTGWEAARAAVPIETADFLGLHEQLLGKNLAELEEDLGPAEASPSAAPAFWDKLDSENGRVLATWAGFLGDAATVNVLLYLGAEGASRARLASGGDAFYRAAYTCRQIIRAPRRLTIGDGSVWIPNVAAYDNSRLVPPFLPVARGQGFLFGAVVRACLDATLGYLPWVVEHVPSEPRTFTGDDLRKNARSSAMAVIVSFCFSTYRPQSSPATFGDEAGLRALGKHVSAVAAQAPKDFAGFVREARRGWVESICAHLEAQLDGHGSRPASWAADVREFLGQIGRSVDDSSSDLPSDLRDLRSEEEARALSQRIVWQFGRLCETWPDILAAARSLCQQGIRLSRQVPA